MAVHAKWDFSFSLSLETNIYLQMQDKATGNGLVNKFPIPEQQDVTDILSASLMSINQGSIIHIEICN